MKLKRDYSKQLHSYLSLRKAVGWLGIALPVVMSLGYIIIFGGNRVLGSISIYYHTGMRDLFVGIICAIALFLLFYRGYDPVDDIAASLAALFALGVAFFPTAAKGSGDWVSIVHFISATCFFLILAFFSFCLFTRGEEKPTTRKIRRNLIYRLSGIIIVLSLASIAIYYFFLPENNSESIFVFIAETVALMAFGTSWLTKGGALYPDKPDKNK